MNTGSRQVLGFVSGRAATEAHVSKVMWNTGGAPATHPKARRPQNEEQGGSGPVRDQSIKGTLSRAGDHFPDSPTH